MPTTEKTETKTADKASLLDGTIDEVLERIGDSRLFAVKALREESESEKARVTLQRSLVEILRDTNNDVAQWAKKRRGVTAETAHFQIAKANLELLAASSPTKAVESVLAKGNETSIGLSFSEAGLSAKDLDTLADGLIAAGVHHAEEPDAVRSMARLAAMARSQSEAASSGKLVIPVKAEPKPKKAKAPKADAKDKPSLPKGSSKGAKVMRAKAKKALAEAAAKEDAKA